MYPSKVESGLISLEKKLSESETLHVKARNTQARFEEDHERFKEQIVQQKAKIGSLQHENKRLDGEAAEQKRLAIKLDADLEKLTQEMKSKVNELEALKRYVLVNGFSRHYVINFNDYDDNKREKIKLHSESQLFKQARFTLN